MKRPSVLIYSGDNTARLISAHKAYINNGQKRGAGLRLMQVSLVL